MIEDDDFEDRGNCHWGRTLLQFFIKMSPLVPGLNGDKRLLYFLRYNKNKRGMIKIF